MTAADPSASPNHHAALNAAAASASERKDDARVSIYCLMNGKFSPFLFSFTPSYDIPSHRQYFG
jgi:hypothetical protein